MNMVVHISWLLVAVLGATPQVASAVTDAAQNNLTAGKMDPIHPQPKPVAPHPACRSVVRSGDHLESDPFAPLNDLVASLRAKVLDPIDLTFQPYAGWTYQHATKVRPNYPSARSALWYGWAGHWRLWQDQADYGQIVYEAGGNTGLGDSTYPYLGEALGNPDYINNILVADRMALWMLYWQQTFFDKSLTVSVGKYEDQIFFDQNTIAYNPVTGFLAENFNEQIVMPFPNYAFGGNMEWKITDDVTLRGGVMNANSAGNTKGFDGLAANQLFTTAELDLTVHPEINGAARLGHWRITPWYNSMENPAGPGQANGWGICLNMDQRVADNVSIFGRLGWGENDATRSNFAVSTGFAVNEPFGLRHHHMGLAFEYAKITQIGRAEVGLPLVPGEQYLLEWYWRVELTNSFDAGPVIQVLRDRGAGVDTSVIWGFRTSWSY